MNRSSLFAIALLAVTHVCHAEEVRFQSEELAPGIYMLEGKGGFTGGNLGLSIGEDGVILIDDSMPPFSEIMLEAIEAVTDQKPTFVLNTHLHGDHTGNNALMHDHGAHVVGHDNIRKRLLESGKSSSQGNVPAEKGDLPVLTFSESISFHLNGRHTHVMHAPAAHTDGDGFVHFPDDNVIHTGDLMFNGLFPYIDLNNGGSVDGYIAAQKQILELADATTRIIPGHGPLANKADLEAAVSMLEDARNIVHHMLDEGKTGAEILAENPLSKYHDDWNWGFITTEKMTQTILDDAAGSL